MSPKVTNQQPAGPYQSERQAHAASLWARGGAADMTKANLADLAAATAGVELGQHDRVIIEWLAGYEPSTVAVICGLIRRAAAGGAR